MAVVHLSNELLAHTGGVETVAIDADRVDAMMAALIARFPDLSGRLERMAVAIDGEIHQDPAFEALTPSSEVHFVPRIAGG
jgi:molybdopterin converting factor small subunit